MPQRGRKRKIFADTLCKICGAKATSTHFNCLACEGCRGFFRRSVLENRTYPECTYNCPLAKVAGKRPCRSCRYRKCIEMGMEAGFIIKNNAEKYTESIDSDNSNKIQKENENPVIVHSRIESISMVHSPPEPTINERDRSDLSIQNNSEECNHSSKRKATLNRFWGTVNYPVFQIKSPLDAKRRDNKPRDFKNIVSNIITSRASTTQKQAYEDCIRRVKYCFIKSYRYFTLKSRSKFREIIKI